MKHIPGQHVNDVNQRANDLVRIFWALDFGSHVKYWLPYYRLCSVLMNMHNKIGDKRICSPRFYGCRELPLPAIYTV